VLTRAAVQERKTPLSPFFGLQHFKGHGLAAGRRKDGLAPSIKAPVPAATQMLHQKKRAGVNLPALWSEEPAGTKRAKRARAASSGATGEYTPQSSYIDIAAPDAVDSDGYVDAGQSPGTSADMPRCPASMPGCRRVTCALCVSRVRRPRPRCSELPCQAQRQRR